MTLTPRQADAITKALSTVRLGTYSCATGSSATIQPLDVYVWNALVSGAFFSSLHICEVIVRNAISSALEMKYGEAWPWDQGFERTLPSVRKNDLASARRGVPSGSTGKVIAELKLAFWCNLLTARQDAHLWNSCLRVAFPLLPIPLTVPGARRLLFDDMEALRRFRNRIAHHEPIFEYALESHHKRIKRLIRWRCEETTEWLAQWEIVTHALATRPR
jgi:hypothetical protein